MLDSRTQDLSLNKSCFAEHATVWAIEVTIDTKIMLLAFVDPILALLGQNDTCLCDFIIFYRCTIEFPGE